MQMPNLELMHLYGDQGDSSQAIQKDFLGEIGNIVLTGLLLAP